MDTLRGIVEVGQWAFIAYWIGLTASSLALNVVAHVAARHGTVARTVHRLPKYSAGLEPGITLLVPAYNEEAVIAASVRSLLQIDYPLFEIVVVDDGSKDDTKGVMIREFDMLAYPQVLELPIATKPVQVVYRSRRHRTLKLVVKANGGKADAMNAAINVAEHPLVCAVDADSVLQRDSLQRLVQPFLEDRRTIAAGGTIRIANGCTITRGHIEKVGMPASWLARFQIVEYLRAFLFGRLGWAPMNAMLIVSGAFGLFRRRTMIEMGGFDHKTIGEDMELTTRMHVTHRAAGTPYRVMFVPDAVCWTQAPEDLATLRSQRARWQRGLLETLWRHRRGFFARGSGAIGWLALPSFALFEAATPVIEVVGAALMALAWIVGALSWSGFLSIVLAVAAFGILLSASSMLLEETHFRLYAKKRHLLVLMVTLVIENLGFRQLVSWWRLQGTWTWMRGRPQAWGNMVRKQLGT